MGEFVNLEVEDGIGTIRLNRPPVNALSNQVQDEIQLAAIDADARADVRSVIVYGGQKCFAGGADIKEMVEMSHADMTARAPKLSAAFSAVAAIRKPTVAAIAGYALGGGLELALCTDHRIAGDNVKLGQPEILLGIIPGAGGTQRLARLIGPARTKDLVFTGRIALAQEALAIGLIDEIVAADDVYGAARTWAAQFTAGPAMAIAAAKHAIDGGLDGDLANGLKLESHVFAALFATDDQEIGMRSFLASGPGKAVFTGK
ncbi:MAG TPA: enoyl-CoA hydratase-related protein [Pseudonocardiaceae bacterium]